MSHIDPPRRPGGKPGIKPRYRVLVHKNLLDRWNDLASRVGLESAQQFYDHVTANPGQPSSVNRTTVLKGGAGRPKAEGFSRTVHYEISGAGRIDFQYADRYEARRRGDPHGVVFILAIDLSSH